MPFNQRLPIGYKKEKNTNIEQIDDEKGLISAFLGMVEKFDPDIIVGHDLYAGIFGLLTNRI
jgi:DNA polymerase elongation subunit (family B)